ncbi:MAG: caspase family protein [Planctomycetes bacterium]|nr:caspase family protein [Planctomycetota bacterium]
MLLPNRRGPAVSREPEPARGVVRSVYLGERTLVIERDGDGRPQEIPIRGRDEILINGKQQVLRDVQPGDRVAIEIFRDASGFTVRRIVATRAKLSTGRIEAVDADEGKLILAADDSDEPLVVRVPGAIEIVFNGKKAPDGRPVTLDQLEPDDRVEVRHLGQETGRTATELSVLRVVVLEGTVRDLDLDLRELTVALAGDDAQLVVLPFAPKCEVTVNGRSELAGQLLKPQDLIPGDTARVSHDTHVVRVDAHRILGHPGVVRGIQQSPATLQVMLEGEDKPTNFHVGPDCKITLVGEPVGLMELRNGDVVDVTHDAPDAKTPEALSISTVRPSDPARWAVIVAIQNYDDRSLSPLDYPIADAKLLEKTLVQRYRVPPEQVLMLLDVSQVRIEQGIPNFLEKVQPEDELIVYVGGHAYRDDDGKIHLAPKNFNLTRITTSGLGLQWLVDRLEECPARRKLLLLDTSNAGTGADLRQQPSAAEMLETLEGREGRAPLRTVTAIAGSSAGQRGHGWPTQEHGIFPYSLSEGYSGGADPNRDCRIEPAELFAFLNPAMTAASAEIQQSQTPRLFLPNDAPPRLTKEAKKAVRRLAALLQQDRLDALAIQLEYAGAEALSAGELDPKLLYGLLLLKARQRTEAAAVFEEIRLEHPDLLLPVEGLVWLNFDKRTYAHGVDELVELIARIPKPKSPDDAYSPEIAKIFQWAGKLREFVETAERESYRPPQETVGRVDQAVEALGPAARQHYEEGRDHARQTLQRFDQQILAGNEATQARLRMERRQPRSYAFFPYAEATKKILAGLDE